MTYVSSPDLNIVLHMPMATVEDVRERIDAAMTEARTWPFPSADGDGYLLVNPAALTFIWVTEQVPQVVNDRPVVPVGPAWAPPDVVPDDLVTAEEAA